MEVKYQITNDVVFQRLFGKIGNENITKGFLEKVLGIKIENLSLDTNKGMIGKQIEDKIGRIDVKAKLQDGTKVIIEMQVARYKHMAKRLLYYWAETYIADLKRGDEYGELNKTIALLLSVEDLNELEGIEKYHTIWTIQEKERCKQRLTEDLEIHIIELNKFEEGKESPEEGWIRFIKGGEIEEMGKVDEILREAKKELERLTGDPELREQYEQRIIDLRDMISYAKAEREDGIEEGEMKTKREVIFNMCKKEMKLEDICEIVNLSRNEVEKIIKEIGNGIK